MGERPEDDEERLSLETAVTTLLDETRILLPGTQTLLGFQLIVVFESSFHDQLSATEQNLHFAAMLLTIVAIALFLTPAAYRLQVEQGSATDWFVRQASRLLLVGTAPLATAICLDAYLVSRVITGNDGASLAFALGAGALFFVLWYVLPRAARNAR